MILDLFILDTIVNWIYLKHKHIFTQNYGPCAETSLQLVKSIYKLNDL